MRFENRFGVSVKAIAAVAVAASALLGGCAVVPGPYGPHVVGPRIVVAAPAPVYVAPAPVYVAPAPVYVSPPVYYYGRGGYHHQPRHGGWYR
jgi:hypothetical protein